MKNLIAFLSVILAFGAFAPVADAGHQRRLAGYNRCGTAVYDTLRCVGYARCGTPVYGWVRDRFPAGCTRPGHCNYHGHVHAQNRLSSLRISSPSIRHSQTHYVTPRAPVRSSFVRSVPTRSSFVRPGVQSRSIRSSHSQIRSSGTRGNATRSTRARR